MTFCSLPDEGAKSGRRVCRLRIADSGKLTRSMKRRLFTILSVLSLVLCLACLLMWVRSGFANDDLQRNHGDGRSTAVFSQNGNLTVQSQHESQDGQEGGSVSWLWRFSSSPGPLLRASWAWEWNWPVFQSGTLFMSSSSTVTTIQFVVLPYWLLTLSTAALPGFWVWRRWKAGRRLKTGLCRICGYDLRATPDRCPECGTPIPSSPTPRPTWHEPPRP